MREDRSSDTALSVTTIRAVHQLIDELPLMEEGMGMAIAMETVRRRLPGIAHGNFTRPVAHPG